MTQKKPDVTEGEQLPSKESNEEGCQKDGYDREHDKLSKPNTGPEHHDQIKNCATGGTRKRKRLRHHSAPQEGSAGRSSNNTCPGSLREGQRCLSLPFNHTIYSCHRSGGMVGDFSECLFCRRCNSIDGDTLFHTSKLLENYSHSFNETKENTRSVVCPQCPRGIKTSRFIQGTKLSKLVRQLMKKNLYKLLLGLIAVFMLLVICSWLDLNHSIYMSTYKCNHSVYYSKLDKSPLDISLDRTTNIIHYDLKCSRKNFPIYNEKLPIWFNENLPAVTISAMHLTLTSTLVPTQRPNPVINWVSYLTTSQSIAGTPTPPLPRVPSILHDDPLYEMTLYPSLLDFQNQCIGDSESNNSATLLVDVSTSLCDIAERDCMSESAILSDIETSAPDCVHDGHAVERHCTLCDMWVCLFCSRANFISTMGIENLMLQSIQTAQSFSNSRSSSRCGNVVSIHRNWWQKNMRHEYISTALEFSPSVTSWSTYDSESDVADVLRSYRTLTSAISSVSSVLGRMTPPVTDTRYSITTDPVMSYLNNYCVSLHAYEPTVLEQCLLHKDALCALDGSGTAVRHIHALRTMGQSFQTQLLRVRRHLPLLRRRGHVVGDGEMPVNGQYPEKNCAAQKSLSEDDEQFYFLESEEESTDNTDQKTEWRGWQFRSKTSSGFQSKTADSKDNADESLIHTRGVLSRTYRQTSAGQTHMNPNCMETSPVYAGGVRPKTSTRRRKLKKAKGSM